MQVLPIREFDVERCRSQFPALAREWNARPVAFLDGPAGSQVPQLVIDAIGGYLAGHNANHGGRFATSRESDWMLDQSHRALADLLGASDPATIVFGANMTTMTFALSRALARTWRAGDEIIVTHLDHDANVTPWVLAARDAGTSVFHVPIRSEDCTLDLPALYGRLSSRTKLVAVGCASNAVGTVNPVAEICRASHAAGALVFLDAVHFAPHALIDVAGWDADFVVCSAYKFFGPHVGVLWGRQELMERIAPYKLRPAPNDLPGRWMTGTQNHECIAGTMAAVDYLASIGRSLVPGVSTRREALTIAFSAIGRYESELTGALLRGLSDLPQVRVWGIRDTNRMSERLPTVSFTHARLSPVEVADALAEQGIFVWHGNFYALPLTEALGLEPEGMVRVGLLHYNTLAEVDRLLAVLHTL
jgi:cysteine desulfurase family protein (TIGR01976 family)